MARALEYAHHDHHTRTILLDWLGEYAVLQSVWSLVVVVLEDFLIWYVDMFLHYVSLWLKGLLVGGVTGTGRVRHTR